MMSGEQESNFRSAKRAEDEIIKLLHRRRERNYRCIVVIRLVSRSLLAGILYIGVLREDVLQTFGPNNLTSILINTVDK